MSASLAVKPCVCDVPVSHAWLFERQSRSKHVLAPFPSRAGTTKTVPAMFMNSELQHLLSWARDLCERNSGLKIQQTLQFTKAFTLPGIGVFLKKMPSDGAHAKFLYTILKQLDLKSIDWSAVASQLEITNGHAARMRFSRFKQHMEGVTPCPRRRNGLGPGATPSGGAGSSSSSRNRRMGVKNEKEKDKVARVGISKKRTSTVPDKIKTQSSPSPGPSGLSTRRVKPEPKEEQQDTKPVVLNLSTVNVAHRRGPDGGSERRAPGPAAMEGVSDNVPIDPTLASRTPPATAFAASSPPAVVPPVFAPVPTRKEFGPFAGVYPPPGAVTTTPASKTPRRPSSPVVKEDELEEEEEVTLVKSEPKGDGE